ncbi:MAG: hypothetical protein MI748_13435 [Opitutales bacterium]|nr:hypothetical protein [Opitutales bacterium]
MKIKLNLLSLFMSVYAVNAALYQLDLEGHLKLAMSASGVFEEGKPFRVSLIYDTDVEDTNPDSEYGLFVNAVKAYAFSYDGGVVEVTAESGNIENRATFIPDLPYGDFTGDYFDVDGLNGLNSDEVGGEPLVGMNVSLQAEHFDGRDNYFVANELPTTFPDPSVFNEENEVSAYWGYPVGGPPPEFIIGHVDSATLTPIVQTIEVDLDVRPFMDAHYVWRKSFLNLVPVIYSTPEFDATQIDPETVLLNGVSIDRTWWKKELKYYHWDINCDGLEDFIFEVKIRDLNLETGDNELTLTGSLFDETEIVSTDSITAF